MYAYERRNEIKKILNERKTISVEEMAKKFYVSESTIRRDLDKISGDGRIRRTYGGAILLDNLSGDLPITIREHENIDAKHIIAQKAIRFIRNGDTLIFDTSSTVTAIVPLLNIFESLTVITNGIKTSYLLNSNNKITTYCTGGRLRENNMSLVGIQTCQRLNEINADIAFISCRGLSVSKGITEASEDEAQVKKAMINAADKTILLCDYSKLDMILMNRVCDIERLYAIICDKPLPENYQKFVENTDVKLV